MVTVTSGSHQGPKRRAPATTSTASTPSCSVSRVEKAQPILSSAITSSFLSHEALVLTCKAVPAPCSRTVCTVPDSRTLCTSSACTDRGRVNSAPQAATSKLTFKMVSGRLMSGLAFRFRLNSTLRPWPSDGDRHSVSNALDRDLALPCRFQAVQSAFICEARRHCRTSARCPSAFPCRRGRGPAFARGCAIRWGSSRSRAETRG